MTTSNLSDTSFLHSNPVRAIERFINCIDQSVSIYVAYSGGMDSTILLHLMHKQLSALNQSHRLVAIHVNHGLQQQADDWECHCLDYCRNLGVEFKALKVSIDDTRQKGVEAAARNKRYSAMIEFISNRREQAGPCSAVLLTGHHQRDQAETVLLNMMRGAGVNGLAAMPDLKVMSLKQFYQPDDAHKPKSAKSTEITHARPLIDVSYSAMCDYAQAANLKFVDDPSNQNSEFKRNWVRNELLPMLTEQWPVVERQLTQTAQNMQDTLQILDESAKNMLQQTVYSSDFVEIYGGVEALQKNLIRYWLKSFWPEVTLSSSQMNWVMESLKNYASSQNHSYLYRLKNVELKIYKNRLYVIKETPQSYQFTFSSLNELSVFLDENAKSFLDKEVGRDSGGFLFKINSLKCDFQVDLMAFSLLPDELKIVLKKQMKAFFQLSHIPVWQREVWPVLYSDEFGLLGILGVDNHRLHTWLLKSDYERKLLEVNKKKNALTEIYVTYEQMTALWHG